MLLTLIALVISLTGEDNVGSVLFREFILDGADCRTGRWLLRRQSRLASWWRRQSFTLGNADKPMAFPGCMVGRVRAAMELAGSIEGLLEGEGGQPGGLAAFLTLGAGLTLWLLIFHCRNLPAGGSRLRGLALVVVLLLAMATTW